MTNQEELKDLINKIQVKVVATIDGVDVEIDKFLLSIYWNTLEKKLKYSGTILTQYVFNKVLK